jgi:spore coat polysaccharide biosynthesis protein SpsF (cytidylyltransferase family)
LTGDNTFPDAALIDEFCDAFLAGGARHLVLGDEGVPYGVYAEAISVEALRELDQQELSAEEREHVTLALRRRSLHRVFIPTWGSPALASLRATIDTVEDFVSIASIFAEASNPLTVPVAELCERLQRRSVDR